MNGKGQLSIGEIVILFTGIVVVLALMVPIFNTTNQMTSKQVTTNESLSVVNAFVDGNNVNESVNFTIYTQSTWKESECPLASVAIRNGVSTALVADTDYTLYADKGIVSLLNTTKTVPDTALNNTFVDYTSCADGYNTGSGARSIANIIGIFAALALFGFAVAAVMKKR